MINLSEYTGPVVNVDAPPHGSYQWSFYCPVCQRQFNAGGAIWRIPTYDENYQEEVLAFPRTVTLVLVATWSNGADRVEIFMSKCHKCATIYQAWRAFINATARERLEYFARNGIYPTDDERKVGLHEWVQIDGETTGGISHEQQR